MRPRRLLRSSAFRLALAYAALFTASALLLLSYLYWSTAGYMLRQADLTIESQITGLAEHYRLSGIIGLRGRIRERLDRQPSGSSIYLLSDARGQQLAGNLDRWPSAEPDAAGWLDFELTRGGEEPVRWARAKSFSLTGGYRLLVGRDMHELERMRAVIVRRTGWGLLLTVALALAGGVVMSRGRIRRIGEIDRAIGEIVAGDLTRRIDGDQTGDDIDELVGKLNHMLGELERLVDGVRRVSDSIAHDLRTPLARLRNRLEALRGSDGGAEERQAGVEAAIADADGLLSTFNSLLRIARIEAGERRAAFADVDLSGMVVDVAELYEPLFDEAGKRLEVSAPAGIEVTGDRDLLFQLLANLIDNGLKFTPDAGRVSIALAADDVQVELVVADDGPGVPEADRERVLQRFFRLDAARHTPGAGLGLSLVSAVAECHHARLRLEDAGPGLLVVVTLPKQHRAS